MTIQLESSRDQIRRLQGEIDKLTNPENLGSDPENTGLNLQSNSGSNLGSNLGSNPENPGSNLGSNLGINLGSNLGSNLGLNLGSNLGSNHGSYPDDPDCNPDDPKNLETEIQSLNILLELRDDKMREQSDKLKDLTSR